MDRRDRQQPAEPPGHPDRRGPLELADRLPVVRRVQRGDAGQHGPRVQDDRTAEDLDRRQRRTCRICRSTRRARPVYPNTLYAGTDVGAFVTTNGGSSWSSLGDGHARGRASGSSTSTPASGCSLAGTHGRGAYTPPTRTPRRRWSCRRPTPAMPVGPRQHHRLHDDGAEHRQRGRDRRHHHRPDPGQHDVRLGRTAAARTVDGQSHWTGLTVPAGGSVTVHFTVAHRRRTSPRSVDSIVERRPRGRPRRRASATTGSPHITPIAPAYAVSVDAGRPDRRRQGRQHGRPTRCTSPTSATRPTATRSPRRAPGTTTVLRRDLHHAAHDHRDVSGRRVDGRLRQGRRPRRGGRRHASTTRR